MGGGGNKELILCKGCNKEKSQGEFYLIDGGLQIDTIKDIRFEICKDCVREYNNRKKLAQKDYRYFLWQEICPYFASKLDRNLKNIDNGMKSSLQTTKQNFNHLFNKPNALSNNNKQDEYIFHKLQNANDEILKNAIDEILQEDYKRYFAFQANKEAKNV